MEPTLSSLPQTQALVDDQLNAHVSQGRCTHAPGGAPGISGSSFLEGNFVLSGSNGIVVAVLLKVKTSAILFSLPLPFRLLASAIFYNDVFTRIFKTE